LVIEGRAPYCCYLSVSWVDPSFVQLKLSITRRQWAKLEAEAFLQIIRDSAAVLVQSFGVLIQCW
jgi:hypothetical protein